MKKVYYELKNNLINGRHSYLLEYYNKALDENDDDVIIGGELKM